MYRGLQEIIEPLVKRIRALEAREMVARNDTYCRVQLSADQVIPSNSNIRVELNTPIYDLGSNWSNADLYGADGAYRQADADSSSTKIEDDDAAFTDSEMGKGSKMYVKWASNAAGTLNTGEGYVNHPVGDTDTLNITDKISGADFAANYYYWIKKCCYVVPVTGYYLIAFGVRISSTEANKKYGAAVVKGGDENVFAMSQWAVDTGSLVSLNAGIALLAAGEEIMLWSQPVSLAAVCTVGYAYNQTHLAIALLQQS